MADVKKPTEAEIQEGLRLLQQKRDRQARIKSGELKGQVPLRELKELNPAMYEKRRAQAQRQSARMSVILMKAKAQGVTATDKEIDDYLAKMAKK